jgi:hypothetical protein
MALNPELRLASPRLDGRPSFWERPSHALPDRKETSRKVTPVSQADLTVSITTRSGTMPIRELLKAESAVFGPDELRDIAAAFEVIRERLGLTNREDPATLMLAKLTIELAKQGEFTAASLRDRVLRK